FHTSGINNFPGVYSFWPELSASCDGSLMLMPSSKHPAYFQFGFFTEMDKRRADVSKMDCSIPLLTDGQTSFFQVVSRVAFDCNKQAHINLESSIIGTHFCRAFDDESSVVV
ncbi:hypothetical protein AVEN_255006-1, partial [Araneus ventricosus]